MRTLVFKNINLSFICSILKHTQNTVGIARPISLQKIKWLNKVQDFIAVLFVHRIYSSKGIQSEYMFKNFLDKFSFILSYLVMLPTWYTFMFICFCLSSVLALSFLLISFYFLNMWNINMIQKSKLYFKSILREISFPSTHCHLRKGRWHHLDTI